MATDTASRPAKGVGTPHYTNSGSRVDSDSRDGTPRSEPIQGDHFAYLCPVDGCPRTGKADYKTSRLTGDPTWLFFCSRSTPEHGRPDVLARALGAPGADRDDVARGLSRVPEPGGPVELLPTTRRVAYWADQLTVNDEPQRYLASRAVSPDVIERERIGWDATRRGGALVFPMYDGGELVAAKWRLPRGGLGPDGEPLKLRSWPREAVVRWPLYPEPDPSWPWVLVCAGELDALSARSVGLPAVSVTLGAGQPANGDGPANAGPSSPWWRDEWTERLMGRRVVVCFDNNELSQAREAVRRLRAEGVRARRLDLRDLSVTDAKGDLNDYLRSGGSAATVERTCRPRVVARRAVRRSS